VGDGGEYFVMAQQIASGRAPSLTAAELHEAKTQLQELGSGFETSLLDYPDLLAADGRQEFLHFFLYPLLVAPAVPVARVLGLHPNAAFTLINALLLSAALYVVARRAPPAACAAGFLSPVVWWVDKAHTEAFLFASVAVAAVVFDARPRVALVACALAGAQNAAIGVTFPLFAVLLWLAARPRWSWQETATAAVGAGIVASPFVYTWIRLGRISPMAEYANPAAPTVSGLLAFVFEPNIGLLFSAPVYAIVLVATIWRALAGDAERAPLWSWAVVVQAVLLAVWAINPNANHGGTPGVNRWALSLLALGLPSIAWLVSQAGPFRAAATVAVTVCCAASVATHAPWAPENYRHPTRLAERMWDAGWVRVTPAEVFAERAQHREPASVPSHDGSCSVLLIAEQQAPIECAPPAAPLPAACRAPGAMCYAVMRGEDARYVPASNNGFFHMAARRSWPAGGPLAAAMRRVLKEADASARVWRAEDPRRWRDEFPDTDIAAVLGSDRAVVVYVARATETALPQLQARAAKSYSLVPFAAGFDRPPALTNIALVLPR
jgi:hypothetical protein